MLPRRRLTALVLTVSVVSAACTSAGPATTTPTPTAAAATPTTAAATPEPSLSAYSARLAQDKKTTVDTSKYKKAGPYVIGVSTQGTFNGWGLMADLGVKWAATDNPDVKNLVVANGDGDASKQISAVENFIQAKVDAILLDPLGSAALSAPVARAMAAGIPVITCLNGVETDQFVTHIDVDLYQEAFDVTTRMANALGGQGNVVILNGIPGVDAAEVWKQAAQDALAKFPNVKIVGNEYTNWSIATATSTTTQLLSRAGRIDGVFAGGSEMAIGAINALSAASQPMPKFGVTNPLNGFLRLAIENSVTFAAAPDPPGASPLCLQYVIKVLKGESVQKFVDIAENLPDSGTYDQTQASAFYKPEYIDDFIYPTMVPPDALLAAGFGRK